ncbi:MAG: multidrug effflux MFS transporter [Alphaproteobacteria bacterium]
MHEPVAIAQRAAPRFTEFVALVALMMAMTALSIDIMLVALPEIGAWYALTDPNAQQYVIVAYMIGFALGQPLYGPLSDRFGRKPVLYFGMGLFILGTVAAVLAPGYAVMLLARGLQGFGSASARVIGVAITRDLFVGRGMSRVMSFVMMVFMIVPIVAPSLGSAILTVGDWRWVFLSLLIGAVVLVGWTWLRLPETLAPENRRPLSWVALASAVKLLVADRQTLGYTVATGFIFGCLIAYISSAEQVFVDAYALGSDFPLVFGSIAATMILASITNVRFVERVGMRRISHAASVALVVACAVFAAIGFPDHPPLAVFIGFLVVLFYCFGLVMPNFNSLAMEPLGHMAGIGSSFIGFYTTIAGAVLGAVVSQSFDGGIRPLMIGFTVLSVLTLISVLLTERGKLFQAHQVSH